MNYVFVVLLLYILQVGHLFMIIANLTRLKELLQKIKKNVSDRASCRQDDYARNKKLSPEFLLLLN